MLKRYLPLLFVVLVVLATAVLFLWLRDSTEPGDPATSPGPAAAPGLGQSNADGVREFRVESEVDYQQVLEALGTSNEEIEAWARSRGFPPGTYTPTPGEPLEHDYRREPERRLRQLAGDGDLWAIQFLARRISPEQPEEAIALYHQAAVSGSAYAAFSLGTLFNEIERWVTLADDNRAELLTIFEREDPIAQTALAWLMVAEYEAGLPPGAMSATVAGFHAPDADVNSACERAAGFLAELHMARGAQGIDVAARKPPLAIELPPEELAGYCAPEVFPRADFSDCETIRLTGESGAITGYRCR